MNESQCEHPNKRVQRHPWGVFCVDCGVEVFPPGYWPDGPIGETVIEEETEEEGVRTYL